MAALVLSLFFFFNIPREEQWPHFISIIIVPSLLTILVFEPFFRNNRRSFINKLVESTSEGVRYAIIGIIGLLALFQFFVFATWVLTFSDWRFGPSFLVLLGYFYSLGLFYSVAILYRYLAPKK